MDVIDVDYFEQYGEQTLGLLPSPYDSRDYAFTDITKLFALRIPDDYETPNNVVYDQGQTSMCAAFSSNMLRYMQENDIEKQSGLSEPLSMGFTYADRLDGEDFEGMYLRSVASKWVSDGSCLKSDFPYIGTYEYVKEQFNKSNKSELLKKANPFRISSYYTCRSREEVQTAIMTTKGVLLGIPVFKSFYYPNKYGIIEYDKNKGERALGGHAVLIRGWRTINNKLYWVLQNSWGDTWGNKGSCLLPEDYPWQDDAYVLVDNITELKFNQYKEKFA